MARLEGKGAIITRADVVVDGGWINGQRIA